MLSKLCGIEGVWTCVSRHCHSLRSLGLRKARGSREKIILIMLSWREEFVDFK